MGKIKGWKKIIDDEWWNTGGGLCYFITFYRNEKNPLKQIEIWQESNFKKQRVKSKDSIYGQLNSTVGLNIGTRYENEKDAFDPIQGDYSFVGSFKTLSAARNYAHKHMRANPNG